MNIKLAISTFYIILVYFSVVKYAFSENEHANIKFVEQDSAECSMSDGKLILIQNKSPKQTYQVWIDRWYMDVQTPDHTKQILLPNSDPSPLGCTNVRSGGKQHWTIHSINTIE